MSEISEVEPVDNLPNYVQDNPFDNTSLSSAVETLGMTAGVAGLALSGLCYSVALLASRESPINRELTTLYGIKYAEASLAIFIVTILAAARVRKVEDQ